MHQDTDKLISKWWLRSLATLLGLSLPGVALLLRSNLETHLASVKPEQLALWLIFLLAAIGLLLALLVLQRPWLKWDEPTGTWINIFNGIRYCGTCRANRLIVPLKNEISGWRCVVCDKFRTDPARKHLAPKLNGVRFRVTN